VLPLELKLVLLRNSRQVIKMADPFAVRRGLIAFRDTCGRLRDQAARLKGYDFSSHIDGLYDSATELSKTLELHTTSFVPRGLDEQWLLRMYTSLTSCESALHKLQATCAILENYRPPNTASQRLVERLSPSLKHQILEARTNIASIQNVLEPTLLDLQVAQADTNTATTSGFGFEFDEGPSKVEYRSYVPRRPSNTSSPVRAPIKSVPHAKEGEVGKVSSNEGSGSVDREQPRPLLHSSDLTEATGERPAREPPAASRKSLLRRIPFCYLLVALGLIFISSSSAVGIYYSVAENAMGDGFTTAGYMLAVGTLVVTPPAAYHYQHCQCWKPVLESARQERMV